MGNNLREIITEAIQHLELQLTEMKKTYGQQGKASKLKYNKHLRPYGKKLANMSTRRDNKEISKDFSHKDLDEAQLEEERITNKKAAEHVSNKENFVGSHTYGEDLGGLGKMYVAYSYGEQHPLYLWYKDTWYYNHNDYITADGEVNKWTKKHLEDLKPNVETQGRPTSFLQKLISKFKAVHHIGDNSHTDLEPGEK